MSTPSLCSACGGATVEATELLPARYRKCTACGFHHQPDRDAGDLRALYDEEYFERFAAGGGYNVAQRQRRHEARVRVALLRRFTRPPGRLLEVGAAGGHFLAAAREAGFDGLGIEPVPELAERARAEHAVDVTTGFLGDVEIPDAGFDAACAFHVLEHLPEPLEALRPMHAALRRGGLLLIEVPNVESAEARRLGPRWANLEPLHHVGHYGPRALRAMIERAGFIVLHTETVPFFSYLPPSVAMRPLQLAHRAALSVRARVPPRGPHPGRHELLRAAARAHG